LFYSRYALVCGSLPFDDDNVTALFRKIRGGLYTLPGHLSQGVRLKCLSHCD
jgi:5'-AMP-activated protein kinase catalytic alpha subunit